MEHRYSRHGTRGALAFGEILTYWEVGLTESTRPSVLEYGGLLPFIHYLSLSCPHLLPP